jgi:hypothetical protein
MNLPFRIFRTYAASGQRDGESIHVVTRTDVQWGGRVFRAPTLPTPHQLCTEFPFFVNFPSKGNPRRRIA